MKTGSKKLALLLFASAVGTVPLCASALDVTCIYNVETGTLEATLPWRNTLGAAVDRVCAAAGQPLQNRQVSPAQIQSNHAMPATPSKKQELSGAESIKFNVTSADKTVVQLINRWATQAGYRLMLNGHIVGSSFPKHPVSYADIAISKAGDLAPQKLLRDAVPQLRAKFVGTAYEKLNFTTVVEPSSETIYVEIFPKTK